MNNEINRMAYYESECKRKDELISALREELGLYQRSSREKDYKLVIVLLEGTWSCVQLCVYVCASVCLCVYVVLCVCVFVCVHNMVGVINHFINIYRYVELEEMLSLKDKEIVEKSRQLEELTMQVLS